MRPLLSRVLALSIACGGVAVWAHDFLGSESCQACHPDAYAAWQATGHARARDVLSPQQQKDVRCLSCHSPNQTDQKAAHVACESCHGGGQFYSANYVMKDPELARLVGLVDPAEKSCRACHDAASPSLKPFDFAAKLKAIDHWTIERQKRKAQVMPPLKAAELAQTP
ncbi:MAG: multiheme c-type cytochrome [Archangium sp.]|nr:multiheme c-type cytochrome [Archangium sp.]MDP3574766.1 multiheme c-type cytochrome [Archangium sp.]